MLAGQEEDGQIDASVFMHDLQGLLERDDFVALAQQVDVPSATHGLKQGPRSDVPVADKYGRKNGFSEPDGQIRYINAHEVSVAHQSHPTFGEDLVDVTDALAP